MQLNQKLINYLDGSKINETIKSNFLLSDLEKILYTATDNSNNYYLSKLLSNDLVSIIEKWNNTCMSEKIIYIENNPDIAIVNNDTHTYSAIMVYPIYNYNKIEGLTIYFRNSGDYINSSIKAPNTIRKWIMKLVNPNCIVYIK